MNEILQACFGEIPRPPPHHGGVAKLVKALEGKSSLKNFDK